MVAADRLLTSGLTWVEADRALRRALAERPSTRLQKRAAWRYAGRPVRNTVGVPAVLASTFAIYWTFRSKVQLDDHSD